MLNEILEKLDALPKDVRDQVVADAMSLTGDRVWTPNPGPQTDAYFCDADELFYGGQAGGGKSALAVGLAMTSHERSLILRRIREDAKNMAEDQLINRILDGDRAGWNGSDLIFRQPKKYIKFGGCELEVDKQRYKGNPHDLIIFDEVSDFLESQYVFITIWNRSTTPGQRCRVVATGNPPTTAEGLWVIHRWAPWLDPKHPNPAKPGELRWYISDEEGKEIEVQGRGPHQIGDRMVEAKSRTFIPASLSDNPDLANDGEYARILDSLPKELRDAYRDGRFDLGLKDHPWQLIPTDWVVAAQARWKPNHPQGIPMCAIGVDVAQGGDDDNVIFFRHDGWFSEPIVIPGKETPLGTHTGGDIIKHRRDGAVVIIDCGGGYGGPAYQHLMENGVEAIPYKGAEESRQRTADRQLGFKNKRSEVWWRFREALDPSQPGGSRITLPPDSRLLSDLTAPTYDTLNKVIRIEPKKDLIKRLGRSTDYGDAAVMCWMGGAKMADSYHQWNNRVGGMSGRTPNVVMGHSAVRRGTRR